MTDAASDVIGPALGLLLGALGAVPGWVAERPAARDAMAALAVALPSSLPSSLRGPPDRLFHPRERAVGDWRWQAAANLDAAPAARAAILLGRDPPAVSRCVRLNNYWCVKRGGWSGEIAADAEGHVAFASAAEGAAVAALLLRRYYLDYGRRSAAAIVSRWAPASCGGRTVAAAARKTPGRRVGPYGGTLRARWLAAHGHRIAGFGRPRGRASSVPDPLIGAALPAPIIAVGLGAAPVPLSASLPEALAGAGPPPASAPPSSATACAADAARLRNYAARAAAGIATSPEADLALFDAAGRPTPNLARLMRNMAAVEIGPLGADAGLVAAAVARASEMVAARRPPSTPSSSDPGRPGARAPARLDEAGPPGPKDEPTVSRP